MKKYIYFMGLCLPLFFIRLDAAATVENPPELSLLMVLFEVENGTNFLEGRISPRGAVLKKVASVKTIEVRRGKKTRYRDVQMPLDSLVGWARFLETYKLWDCIEFLDLSDNALTSVTLLFEGGCTALKSLDLSGNELKTLPDRFDVMPALLILNISKNKLRRLPQSIGSLTKLAALNCAGNKISALPDELSLCLCLATLNMEDNDIEDLTEFLFDGSLPRLTEVTVQENLTSFHPSYSTCPNIMVVYSSILHDVLRSEMGDFLKEEDSCKAYYYGPEHVENPVPGEQTVCFGDPGQGEIFTKSYGPVGSGGAEKDLVLLQAFLENEEKKRQKYAHFDGDSDELSQEEKYHSEPIIETASSSGWGQQETPKGAKHFMSPTTSLDGAGWEALRAELKKQTDASADDSSSDGSSDDYSRGSGDDDVSPPACDSPREDSPRELQSQPSSSSAPPLGMRVAVKPGSLDTDDEALKKNKRRSIVRKMTWETSEAPW